MVQADQATALRLFISGLQLPAESGIGQFARRLTHGLLHLPRPLALTLAHGQPVPALPRVAGGRPVHLTEIEGTSYLWEQCTLPGLLRAAETEVFINAVWTAPLVNQCRAWVSIHDLIPTLTPQFSSATTLWYWQAFLLRSLRASVGVLTTSEQTRRQIIDHLGLPPERVRVVRQSIDPLYLAPLEPSASAGVGREYALERPYLLAVGEVCARKAIGELIHAFSHLARREPELELVIAGRRDGTYPHPDTHAGKHGVQGRIRYLGAVPQQHLPALYAGAELLVFPSAAEGFGRPPLEAMACGCPALTRRHPSIEQSTGGHAYWLPDPPGGTWDEESAEAWAGAMAALLGKNRPGDAARAAAMAFARQATDARFATDVMDAIGSVPSRELLDPVPSPEVGLPRTPALSLPDPV